MPAEDSELTQRTLILPSPGKGKGLFARLDLPKGTVVARMREPARMKRSEVEGHLAQYQGLPEDFVIYAPRSPLVFYDASWDGSGRVPRWYRLNHSRRPNTAPCILNPDASARDQEMAWITIKKVAAGYELTFCYENAPSDWS